MANRRMIHRNVSVCEQLADCSMLARLLYTWGLPHTSDWGVLAASPRRLKAQVFPIADETPEQIGAAAEELVVAGLWVRFHDGESDYVYYPTFDKYQDIHQRREKPRDGLPLPPNAAKFPEVPGSSRKSPPKRSEEKGREGKRTKAHDSASDDAAPASGLVDDPPADPPKPPKEDNPIQAVIRQAWEATGGTGAPKGTGYSGLVKLVQQHGIPKVEAWVAWLRSQSELEPPEGASRWEWFKELFRRAMNRDFEWQGKPGGRAQGGLFYLDSKGQRVQENRWDQHTALVIRALDAEGKWDRALGMAYDDDRHPGLAKDGAA